MTKHLDNTSSPNASPPQIGIDAYLLVGFILSLGINVKNFVELGAGSGIASCTLAKSLPKARGLGLDILPESIDFATKQAINANIQERVQFMLADVEKPKQIRTVYAQCKNDLAVDVVLTNPPYHAANSGRVSKNEQRSLALHQGKHTLDYFCAAATTLLKHHGHFFCIYCPKHITKLLTSLHKHKLGLRHLIPIHSRNSKPVQWIIVHAQYHAKEECSILPSISLYNDAQSTTLSPEILQFCPWIACS